MERLTLRRLQRAFDSYGRLMSRASLLVTVFIASPSFHRADQNEKAENGSQLGERFDWGWHAMTKGAAGKNREHKDGKSSPDQHQLTSMTRAPSWQDT